MKKRGNIVVIRGSMFSGKTQELLLRLRREKYRPGGKAQAFKPSLDTRYSDSAIVTHEGEEFPCTLVDRSTHMLHLVDDDTTMVGIDEGQFYDTDEPKLLYETCIALAKTGRDVWVACLSQDYQGKPFENVSYVMAVANKIIEKKAVCSACGSDEASYSQRMVDESAERLVLGSKGVYDARCKDCFLN